MQDLKAACVQPPPGGTTTPEYLDNALREAGRVDLAVLPELCNVPYFPLERGSWDADDPPPPDGPLVRAFGEVARRHHCHVALGLYLGAAGKRWNSVILLGPDGSLLEGRTSRAGTAHRYDKVHLCDIQMPQASFCESSYFDAGEDFVVWDTPLGTIGALVCYDRHFPRSWTSLRGLGAEIVCVCTTSPVSTEPTFVAEMQGMALQLEVFVAMANRVGTETLRTTGTTTEFLGASCLLDPEGRLLAAALPREARRTVTAELKTELLSRARRQNQFWERRRADIYIA
jgi:beta-ureidopropionase